MKPNFATLYNDLMAKRRGKFASEMDPESLTEQSHAQDADINIIMGRYQRTGMLPQIQQTPLYGDFTEVGDFRQMQERLRMAQDAFMEVPAKIRQQFGNDMQAFVDFCTNPDNKDELVRMGLANAPQDDDDTTTPPPARKTTRYDDYGEHPDDEPAERDAGHRNREQPRTAQPGPREGTGAVRDRQGLQQGRDREPR